MLDSNRAASRRVQRTHGGGEPPSPEDLAPREPPQEIGDPTGSWQSHLGYGLGAIAFVAPMFIPGIPHRVLLATDRGVGALLMIVPIVWGVIQITRNAVTARRGRPRRRWLM